MPLRDVTSVIFDRGTGPFNEEAALEAYHLVAKMDDASASEFIYHVVNEVLETTITENRDLIQKHVDRTVAKALVYGDLDAKVAGLSAAERAEVKKQLLSAVSKASDAEENAWAHRDKKGRFTSFNHPVGRMAVDGKQGKALEIPAHPDFGIPEDEGGMTAAQKAEYRGQYLQIANHLNQYGGFNGENDVRLHYENGDSKPIVAASKHSVAGAINPHNGPSGNVTSVDIRPYKPTLNGRVVDLTQSLGTGLKTVGGPGANQAQKGDSGFVQQWYSAHPTNSTQQMYNRIGAGSQLLGQVAPNSPKLQAAAGFGSLVGQHGSQAEAAFGPPIRRMAYRYRGTERRPTSELANAYGDAVHSVKSANGNTGVPTWQEREAGREVIVDWLRKEGRAPSRQLSSLQLAAGHTPPSEGVLLNADGQIVTTAVGSADDWYLPFNLKHLSQLKGGEYIRSRSTGGITPEDIYTGLMTGARKVTVVSRSGVFTVNFDSELRGGRRNNDKALRMTQRYNELLDAVQSGQVKREQLDGDAQREIKSRIMADPSLSPDEKREQIKTAIEDQMKNPDSIDAEIDEANAHWDSIAADHKLSVDESAARQRELADLHRRKEYYWKLNGVGYEGALKALQEQFPYYITTEARFQVGRSAPFGRNDTGYVEPGALRPTAARANLFGGAIGPNGGRIREQKQAISARNADHAKPMVDRYGGDSESGVQESAPEPEPKGPSGGGAGRPQQKISDRLKKQEAGYEAVGKVQANLASWLHQLKSADGVALDTPDTKALHEYAAMSPLDFQMKVRQEGGVDQFKGHLDAALSQQGAVDYPYPGRQEMEAALGSKPVGKYSYEGAVAMPNANFDMSDFSPEVQAKARDVHAGDTPLQLEQRAKAISLIDRIVAAAPAAERQQEVQAGLSDQGLWPADEAHQKELLGLAANPDSRKVAMLAVQVARSEPEGALGGASGPKALVPVSPEVERHAQSEEERKFQEDLAAFDERRKKLGN